MLLDFKDSIQWHCQSVKKVSGVPEGCSRLEVWNLEPRVQQSAAICYQMQDFTIPIPILVDLIHRELGCLGLIR